MREVDRFKDMDIERKRRRERDGNRCIGCEKERDRREKERDGGLNRLIESKTEREREREKRYMRYIKRDGNRWKRWIASERRTERVRERRTEKKR